MVNITEKELKKAYKLFDDMKVPVEYWRPLKIRNGYSIYCSDRSRAKTTNTLLLYMTLAYITGTYGTYIRNRSQMITFSKMIELFNVINEFNYIDIMTNGVYNIAVYNRHEKTFYYKNTRTDEMSEEPFLYVVSVDKNEEYKSSLTLPRCIYSIFDEFINSSHLDNEFVKFEDLLKTIYRDRDIAFITMLANTINNDDLYFHEFNIYDYVRYMGFGDKKTIISELGTRIYIEILDAVKGKAKEKRSKINELLFGFNNPKLASITGTADTWNIINYRHIEHTENEELLLTRFVKWYDNILRVDLMLCDNVPLVYVYKFNYIRDGVPYYTNDERDTNPNAYIMIRDNKVNRLFIKLFKLNRFCFATNEIGNMCDNIAVKNHITKNF